MRSYSNLDDSDEFSAPFQPFLAFSAQDKNGQPVRLKLRIDDYGHILQKNEVAAILLESYGIPMNFLDDLMSGDKVPLEDF